MADWFDGLPQDYSLPSGTTMSGPASPNGWVNGGGPSDPNDAITKAFTAAAGRAPTQDEWNVYNGAAAAGQNWQQQLQMNAAAPNGYSNYLQYGSPTGSAAPSTPSAPAAPSQAQTFAPQGPLTLPQMAAPTPYALPTLQQLQDPNNPNFGAYQFALQQGILGTEHSDIAKGTGLGGAALKDIAGYTTGLANQYAQQNIANTMNANQLNFGQNLATNQFNSGNQLSQFGANLGANQQFWGQGLAENQNAYNQYRGLQNDAFNQWLSLAQLGNPGNPYA